MSSLMFYQTRIQRGGSGDLREGKFSPQKTNALDVSVVRRVKPLKKVKHEPPDILYITNRCKVSTDFDIFKFIKKLSSDFEEGETWVTEQTKQNGFDSVKQSAPSSDTSSPRAR